MRDYLATYLSQAPDVLPVHATPEQVPKLTKPMTAVEGEGFGTFGTALPREYAENKRTRAAVNPAKLEGRARNAWLQRIGVERLPLTSVCHAVSATTREADLLFAALALADGLPAEHVAEELRRVSSSSLCSMQADHVVHEALQRKAEVLTRERIMAYVEAHPFRWELQLTVKEYKA